MQRSKYIIVTFFLVLSTLYSQEYNREDETPFVLWSGTDSLKTLMELAAYCAPVFWLSPDEPELRNKKGKDIDVPTYFPFETPCDSPVVYYQFKEILVRENVKNPFVKDENDKINVDLSKIEGFEVHYSDYFTNEAGLGGHKYDTEQSQFKIFVRHKKTKEDIVYQLILLRINAKAHALGWYDNIWKVDTNATEVKLPVHIFVEEGKHASCPDINADGYYTPGYDVNVRTNDAWGIRDVIRTGQLFTSEYQSYFSKVRRDEHKVFPPLPADSPLRVNYSVNGTYSKDNAVYALRPFPDPKLAGSNRLLKQDMEKYYMKNVPEIRESNEIVDWFEEDIFIKSFAVAGRYDNKKAGISVSFPLLIVKNIEAPLIGGWIVNRIYAQDKNLRDFGYNILLTPSASRFMDPYFAAGFEIDNEEIEGTNQTERTWKPVLETGLKFRANVTYSPFKFLRFISDFWGLRIGIKNTGFPVIKNLNYIIEFGAGVW